MPALGLGTWKSEQGEVYQAIRDAIAIGYRHFDCAFIYENELEIGKALRDAMSAGEVKRSELWITSKLWNTHHEKGDVIEAIQGSLKAFGLDYLDLYLIHWPVAQKKDVIFPADAEGLMSLSERPLQTTWEGMEKAVEMGLARHIGVSNFSAKKLAHINQTAKIKIEVNQVELHPLLQQKKLLTFCKDNDIVLTAYSPLGSRDRIPQMKAENEPDMFENEKIISIAEAHSSSPAQILIAWAINRGTVVIPKSTNKERLQQNIDAAVIQLSAQEIEEINALDKHFRYVTGAFFALPKSDYTLNSLWDE
jgi:alcohol dehydrogenase (NADP+)